jgi:hypothetical protein
MALYFCGLLGLRSICSFIYQIKYYLYDKKVRYRYVLEKNKARYLEDGKNLTEYVKKLKNEDD